ncbi:MAG: PEP-CTERM sorting domain-containing protein [Nibricoccus sp.]
MSSLEFEFQTQSAFYPNNAALDGVTVSALPVFMTLPNLQGVPSGQPSPTLPAIRPYLLSSAVTSAAVPEPASYGVAAALGLIGLAAISRRTKALG